MSTALQDAIRRAPARTLTDQQPGGNIPYIYRLGNDNRQVTIAFIPVGLQTYENTPFVDPSEPTTIPVEIHDIDANTTQTVMADIPPTVPRSEIIIDYTPFENGGRWAITIPALQAVSETGVPLGEIPSKTMLLTNLTP